jgi:hypothetical protein
MALPERLRLNAFTGALDPGSALHEKAKLWIAQEIAPGAQPLGKGLMVDPSDWTHPEVGWGLVLPDNLDLSPPERATAADAPEPIQHLLEYRKGVVLRWSIDLPATKIRRYYEDGKVHDPHLALSPPGTARGCLPRYLMIHGSPKVIPWEFQYRLNAVCFAGRLDLDQAGLANYVDAALTDWKADAMQPGKSVVWAVDHGGADITHLMRRVVAKKVFDKLHSDEEIGTGALFLDGAQETATAAGLIAALAERQPGLVITTSHGMTNPLNDIGLMSAQLGLLVDGNCEALDINALLAQWSPGGAIWYAHACCSAGSDASTAYEGLVAPGSYAEQVLTSVAKCGALSAPLPRALLGAKRPLRAFLGHVEPTFDWTLSDKATGQVLTDSLSQALYNRLYSRLPVGYAFKSVHEKASMLDGLHRKAKEDFNNGADSMDEALTCRLVAQDMKSLVILGDPVAAMPTLLNKS